ncbi:MAG TPA: hypothetical protein ENK55_08870 [Actinobacteria bacterium]|nr:hypothetical protein [Actinomycetota bacterium]
MTLPLMNIGGLASGLDTNTIISQLMEVERIPIRQLETRKAGYEAKDRAWQQIDARFAAIRSALDAVVDAEDLGGFVAATTSNDAVATATAGAGATPGTVTFTVDRLAVAHQVVSNGGYASATAAVGAGDLTITVDGVATTFTAQADTTLSDFAAQINAADLGVTASVLQVDGSTFELLLTADETGADAAFTTSSTIAGLATPTVVAQGEDAQLTIGSGAGALTLTRASNEVTDLLPGVTIDLVGTGTVTVTTNRDLAATADAIVDLVDEVNTTLRTLQDAMRYDATSGEGGPLLGDSTARRLVDRLRSALSGTVRAGSPYPTLSSIGISLGRDGTFTVDRTKLDEALADDFEAVTELLTTTGTATDGRVSYVTAGTTTVDGTYDVVVTQAATRPVAESNDYVPPTTDATFQIVVGGTTVDVTVAAGSDVATAVATIDAALAAAGVDELTVSQVTVGGNDRIRIEHARYGSSATFTVSGDPFGLDGTYTGTDVAGTIGGEAATGSGRTLTAEAGSPDGLVLTISATQAEVDGAGGTLALGTVTFQRGAFGVLDRVVDDADGATGSISRAQDRWQAQIDLIDDRIADLEARLDRKEALLVRQFAALESAMAQLTTQANWLAAQLASFAST